MKRIKSTMTRSEWIDFWVCLSMGIIGCAVMYGIVWALWVVL